MNEKNSYVNRSSKYREDRNNFSIILKSGNIISLSLMILLFKFTPSCEKQISESPAYYEPVINIEDIPVTKQENLKLIAAPKKLKPVIPTIVIEKDPEPIEEIDINEIVFSETDDTGKEKITSQGKDEPLGFSSLPYIPRQIIEVFPEKSDDDAGGAIKLSLLIGKDGKVVEHKVLKNTTTSQKCFQSVIRAAYKSQWMPVSFDGSKVEFWLEKVYRFN